jgi:hypothetical protein
LLWPISPGGSLRELKKKSTTNQQRAGFISSKFMTFQQQAVTSADGSSPVRVRQSPTLFDGNREAEHESPSAK